MRGGRRGVRRCKREGVRGGRRGVRRCKRGGEGR